MSAATLRRAASDLRDMAKTMKPQAETDARFRRVFLNSREYLVLEPAVALTVANWLDHAAHEHDEDECFRFEPPNGCYEARHALRIARAYLGESA